MTIAVSSARATALSSAEESNNPFFTGVSLTGTLSTSIGTQVLSADNSMTETTFDSWTATPDGSNIAALQLVLAGNESPKFGAIAVHNLSEVSATVSLQYSTNSGSTWTDAGAGTVTPSDNQAIGWRITGITADYWRVYITGATDDVSIGRLWLGDEIIMPRRFYQGYAPPLTPTEVVLETNESEGAHLLGSRVIRRSSKVQASFANLEASFVRGATWLAFQRRFNDGAGTFFAWRPTKYGDLHYGWRDGGQLIPQNSGPQDRMSLEVNMRLYDE